MKTYNIKTYNINNEKSRFTKKIKYIGLRKIEIESFRIIRAKRKFIIASTIICHSFVHSVNTVTLQIIFFYIQFNITLPPEPTYD